MLWRSAVGALLRGTGTTGQRLWRRPPCGCVICSSATPTVCAAAPSASVMKQIMGRRKSIESDQRLAATAVYPNPANPMVGASALEAPVTHHRLVTYHTADSLP
ncbi:unnamed protein product [Urochloa humidicola]